MSETATPDDGAEDLAVFRNLAIIVPGGGLPASPPLTTCATLGLGVRGEGWGVKGEGLRVRVKDYGSRVTGYGLMVTGEGLRIVGYGVRAKDYG
jgi:hypothetical protein